MNFKKFKPYAIHHVGITEITDGHLPVGPSLYYFWWREIPLGHLWFKDKFPSSLADFRKHILNCIKPSIDHYLSAFELSGDWVVRFLNGENDPLNTILSAYLLQAEINPGSASNDPISIVICTRNRAVFLEKCIEALMDSTDKNFELIIVDNAPSDDSTKKVVAKFPSVRYVLEPRKGLDIARNTGARSASHSIIAYTDDDVVIERKWVSKVKMCFNDPMTMSVTGQVFPVELRAKPQYIFEKYWGFNKGYKPVVFDHKYFMDSKDSGVPVWNIGAGANMAFRRVIFDIAGWFDERLDVGAAGCSGDSEFWYRILAEGWNCFYCPQLFVYHNHRDSAKSLTNQVFNYMRGQVASLYVQYENYGHEANLKRINEILPEYYKKRIINLFLKGSSENDKSIVTEIKGCISGKRFYKSVEMNKRIDPVFYSESLSQPAVVNDNTLISVIITCYNYGRYLDQAIDSIIDQSYKNVEIVVVDDGSTDNTQEVLKRYPKVKAVKVHRVGVSAARNIGIQHSSGDYLIFLDADDYLLPYAIETNLYFFGYYPSCVFISGGHYKVSEERNVLHEHEGGVHLNGNYLSLLHRNYIGMEATVLYRRALFQSFHFDTSLSFGEDYELNLRITKCFPSFTHAKPVTAYRMHDNSLSGNKQKMYESLMRILRKQYSMAEKAEERIAIDNGIRNWEAYFFVSSVVERENS